jgi:non-specific protein-tyrosine kinase
VRSIVVTSSHRDEGKSTTSCNLAIALATDGERVLLVEADLRRPRLGQYLGLESAVGLTNVLVGQVDVDEVVQPWGEAGVSVLLCGSLPPNPSELLGSQRMAALLDTLTTRYDRVILDTPPLLPVTDGAVVAAQADGVIVVCRSAVTSAREVSQSVGALRSVDARVLGCVLTMHRVNARDGSYYVYSQTLPPARAASAVAPRHGGADVDAGAWAPAEIRADQP